MAAADCETLLAELDRLLDVGEPLLAVFPRKCPDNISDEMGWYANEVARRSWHRKLYQYIRQQDSSAVVAASVAEAKAGLLGWRAIGVLPGSGSAVIPQN